MARYTGPAFKKSRRVGFSTLENGKDIAKRPYKPGEHGNDRRAKPSEYSTQLTEKQKLRFMYGLTEKQFRKTLNEALKMPGVQGENLLRLLESRLDNLVYRIGFARTRRGARQLVNHGHILVDGKKVDIPSFRVDVGSTITLKDKDKNMPSVLDALENMINRSEFVSYDEGKMEGKFVRMPERSELNSEIDESLVIEYYNRA